MSCIAIILARGGSKRLPLKNQRILLGKPLVAWTIEAAMQSSSFDRILLSTDSREIADIGLDYGLEVPFLRDRAFDDYSPSSIATLAALDQAEGHWNQSYEVVVQLMANCPLRTASDISAAIANFKKTGATSQISCCKFGWANPWWAARLTPEGRPLWMFPESCIARSQDLPDLFCPTGAIWIALSKSLRIHQSFYTPDLVLSPIDWMSSIDIDDQADWTMAEACMLLREGITKEVYNE